MCFINDGHSAVWNEQTVRARKPWRCDECQIDIPVGANHLRVGSLYDGSWETHRFCFSCDRLRDAVREHELAEGCSWDESSPPIGELLISAKEIRLLDFVDDDPGDGEGTGEYHAPKPPQKPGSWLYFQPY